MGKSSTKFRKTPKNPKKHQKTPKKGGDPPPPCITSTPKTVSVLILAPKDRQKQLTNTVARLHAPYNRPGISEKFHNLTPPENRPHPSRGAIFVFFTSNGESRHLFPFPYTLFHFFGTPKMRFSPVFGPPPPFLPPPPYPPFFIEIWVKPPILGLFLKFSGKNRP